MKRYKYKLNMLEPGIRMIQVMVILGLVCGITRLLTFTLVSRIIMAVIVVIAIILILLLLIEHHQDEGLNQQAIEERENKKDE